MRYLVKLATRGRPEKFRATMKNIFDTTKTDDYLVVVSIDENDETMMPLLGDINNMPRTACYVGKPWGKIHAINRDVNPYIPWDILVNMSDDMSLSDGWDDVVKQNVKAVWGDSTDFFYHCNDQHVSERLPTMAIMGREFYFRFGYIYHPSYKSVSADAEQFYVAITLGKHKYFPEPIVEHRHPVNVKQGYDAVYKQNDKYADGDTETYFRRMKQNFYIPNCGPTVFDQHKR